MHLCFCCLKVFQLNCSFPSLESVSIWIQIVMSKLVLRIKGKASLTYPIICVGPGIFYFSVSFILHLHHSLTSLLSLLQDPQRQLSKTDSSIAKERKAYISYSSTFIDFFPTEYLPILKSVNCYVSITSQLCRISHSCFCDRL